MGAVVECFRHHPATLRSAHPTVSFAANGADAAAIVADHRPHHGMGEQSPLGALYRLDAKVLLLGVDHGNCTSLHLAEHRATWPSKHRFTEVVPVLIDGQRRSVSYDD